MAPLLADLPPERFAPGPLAPVPAAAAAQGVGPTPDSALGRPFAVESTGYYTDAYRSQFAVNF